MPKLKKITKYEVRSEGDLVEAEFDDRAEAEEFLKGLDDTVLPLELVEVVETVLETRNADKVLGYRPKPKSEPAKKRRRKAAKIKRGKPK